MYKSQVNILKGYNMLLYFAGSMIMYKPTEECIIDFWLNGSLKKMPVISSNPRFIIASALLRDSCNNKHMCKKMLADDYQRLFDLKGKPLAPACASLYLKKDRNSGRLVENTGEFYKTYGWKPEPLTEVPEDHLGIELLFLTRLIDRYMNINDDPNNREMKKEIRRFINQHILSWIPEWNRKIQECAHTLCYKGIGTLIHACVEDIYGILI
jgi:TorA maturation chaperone TorD